MTNETAFKFVEFIQTALPGWFLYSLISLIGAFIVLFFIKTLFSTIEATRQSQRVKLEITKLKWQIVRLRGTLDNKNDK